MEKRSYFRSVADQTRESVSPGTHCRFLTPSVLFRMRSLARRVHEINFWINGLIAFCNLETNAQRGVQQLTFVYNVVRVMGLRHGVIEMPMVNNI